MYCKTKRWTAVLVACLLLMLAAGVAQAQETEGRRRGFMLEFGLGLGYITYGENYDAALQSFIVPGVDRLNFSLNLALGGAINQNVYLVGVAEGFASRLYDSYNNYIQVNSYLFGLGLRIYPFHTGLQLGLDAGYAIMNEDDNGNVADYPSGWGVAASIGWDVSRRATGFSAILGIKANYNSIDYAPVLTEAFAVTAFVDLIIK